MLKNTKSYYGSVTITLHWLMFLLFVGMVTVGFIMTEKPLTPEKLNLYSWHKSFGITILALAALRLLWRWVNRVPELPENMPGYQKLAAHLTHYALYFLMFFIPLTGWLMSSAANFPVMVFKTFQLPQLIAPDKELQSLFVEMHEIGVYVLLVVVGAHAVAALVHHYYYKDTILVRMLPGKKG